LVRMLFAQVDKGRLPAYLRGVGNLGNVPTDLRALPDVLGCGLKRQMLGGWLPARKRPTRCRERKSPAARNAETTRIMEAELATLERLDRLSSSSKRETERHRDIARKGVHHCQKLGVEPRGLKGKMCTRLGRRLEEGGPAPSAKDREYGPDG
jgi:hypothetical protein